jgi:transposase InsO family protein
VVVTDGSNLCPAVLAELWPDARHQLCVFHVLKKLRWIHSALGYLTPAEFERPWQAEKAAAPTQQ